jgi:hypothetical protein
MGLGRSKPCSKRPRPYLQIGWASYLLSLDGDPSSLLLRLFLIQLFQFLLEQSLLLLLGELREQQYKL